MMRRFSALVVMLAAGACAPVVPPAIDPPPVPPPTGVLPGGPAPTPAEVAEGRAILERELAASLGAAVLAEVRAAPAAVAIRRPVQFPRMVRQPDGTFVREPAALVAAVRGASGWTRIAAGGRAALDPVAGAQLDRLLAAGDLWAEPPAVQGCTDGSGIGLLVRAGPREKFGFQPCGFVGRFGEIGRIVLEGRIADWTSVPPAARPDGLALGRFPEEVMTQIRFTSGIAEPRRIAIRSQREWVAQWQRMTQGRSDAPPAVDFPREMVLMAAMGAQPSGGYRVIIERVLPRPGGYDMFVRHVRPGARCGAIAMITQPVDLVRVPATDDPLNWIVEESTQAC